MPTQNEPINTSQIQQFIQLVKSADNSGAKELKLPIQTAKNLAYSLGIVMSRLNEDLEKILVTKANNTSENLEIKVDPGNSW